LYFNDDLYNSGRIDKEVVMGYGLKLTEKQWDELDNLRFRTASAVLLVIMSGHSGYDIAAKGLGQNGWGVDYLGQYQLVSAVTFEFVATLLFVIVILGSTQQNAPAQFAGLAIGITLVVIHIFGINITGVSVNPARSLGPALFVGGKAISQLWLFLIVPSIAGILAGILFRTKLLEK
jgi:aquaporin Z